MAHFLGEVSGSRGKASRLGSKKSGLKTTAASWGGAITVDLDFNELTGKSTFSVWQREWRGHGINGSAPLAEGVIGDPVKKDGGINANLLGSLKWMVDMVDNDPDGTTMLRLYKDHIDLARNVIKKAEG